MHNGVGIKGNDNLSVGERNAGIERGPFTPIWLIVIDDWRIVAGTTNSALIFLDELAHNLVRVVG